jgi:CelD/BcsL family acetyltransferase involved in cellulose biosynthesis
VAEAELIVDLAELERLAPAWDALSLASSEPSSGPAWMLAWWRHASSPGGVLRVVAVRERDELIGILPLGIGTGARRLELLASADDFSASLTPLAAPGRVAEVAAAAAALLAGLEPRAPELALGPIPASSPWPTALRERWPGRIRPVRVRRDAQPAPIVMLRDGSLEAWLEARSYRFRKNARRALRRFEEAGGRARWSTAETLEADLAVFARLHAARWEGIGASRLVALGAERLVAFLRDLAGALLPSERFRMLMLELDGETICADLWIAGGGDVVGVNTGWDERFKHLSPPTVATLRAIEDCFARGERRIHLGFGRLDYKRAWANAGEVVVWERLLLPGAALPGALLRAAPGVADRRLRAAVKRVATPAQAQRLRALRDRLGLRRDRGR